MINYLYVLFTYIGASMRKNENQKRRKNQKFQIEWAKKRKLFGTFVYYYGFVTNFNYY